MDFVTDSKGRKIALRNLTVVDQARLLRAVGPRQSENQPYWNLVVCAAMATDIDGVPVPMPTSEAQIDGLLGRLGDEGVAALMARQLSEIQRTMAEAEVARAGGEAVRPDPLEQSAA